MVLLSLFADGLALLTFNLSVRRAIKCFKSGVKFCFPGELSGEGERYIRDVHSVALQRIRQLLLALHSNVVASILNHTSLHPAFVIRSLQTHPKNRKNECVSSHTGGGKVEVKRSQVLCPQSHNQSACLGRIYSKSHSFHFQ